MVISFIVLIVGSIFMSGWLLGWYMYEDMHKEL